LVAIGAKLWKSYRAVIRIFKEAGAMELVRKRTRTQPSAPLQKSDLFTVTSIGIGVIFASLGLGEAVYRVLFLEFDGATDRLPIEMLFGLLFAWFATKLVRRIYLQRMERSARIRLIKERNYKIRHALGAISPVPYATNQQAIRVIREEVDRIDWALAEIMPQSAGM
jgi:hypothetical protein